MSKEERHALSTLQKTTTFKDGRYEVGLLWHPNASLPNNFTVAIQQFKKMNNRLSQQPDLHAMYQDTIDKDIDKGYIRKLESHEIPTTGWILPEHGVYSHVKASLRRVSNAAAKLKITCLNDMLPTAPDLLANLVGVILRFRQKKIPISADIEGMYISKCAQTYQQLPPLTLCAVSSLAMEPLYCLFPTTQQILSPPTMICNSSSRVHDFRIS